MLKTEAYINGAACISPQKTIDGGGFHIEISEVKDVSYMKCLEPVYKKYIDPMIARRMSRIVKMGIYAAKTCLEISGIENPDAVITGTGLGCIEDTEKFLSNMILNEEKLLNPTPFIQSTHNTIGSQISLFLKCHEYNSTYAHRGLSFESALLDGLLMLAEKSAENVLVGGVDEVTTNSLNIQKRFGHYKSDNIANLNFLENKSKGSIAGEGASFFLLSDKPASSTYAKIASFEMHSNSFNKETLKNNALLFIQNNNLDINDVDLVLLGINGDYRFNSLYDELANTIFKENVCTYFKHLCGEYSTATSFALWLSAMMIKNKTVPEYVRINKVPYGKLKNILICNNYRTISHSFILLKDAEL